MMNIFGINVYPILIFATFLHIFVNGEGAKCPHSKEKIFAKLLHLIDDPVEVSQILHFLTKQEEISGSYHDSPSWNNLCLVYNEDRIFGTVAHLLNKDEIEKINKYVDQLYEEFQLVRTDAKDSIPAQLKFSDLLAGSAQSMDKIMASLTPSVKAKILNQIPNIYALQTVGTKMILHSELLAGVYLSWETFYNIYRWWHGEISGSRAAKNIIDSMAIVAGGATGASAGATFGSFVGGPIGAAIGGGVGAIYGSLAAGHYSDIFTRHFFDLPKNEALENAYRVLGVHHEASNFEVNRAFRTKCKEYHPDRAGGSEKRFVEVQYYMTVIKAARGEVHK